MKSILVTGINGLLGREVYNKFKKSYDIVGIGRNNINNLSDITYIKFDLSRNDYAILKKACQPDIIINCAAMTDHEVCEKNIEMSFSINSFAPLKLLDTFPDAYLIHISTDAVFGKNDHFPDENVKANPFGIYGLSKFIGEQLLIERNRNVLILRTTIVGIGGLRLKPSFVEWILKSLKDNKDINLFVDTLFSPISIYDFSDIIECCINSNLSGLFHCAGGENISKYDFGLKLAKAMSLDTSKINKGYLANSKFEACRRNDQTLNSQKIEKILNLKLPDATQCINQITRRTYELHQD